VKSGQNKMSKPSSVERGNTPPQHPSDDESDYDNDDDPKVVTLRTLISYALKQFNPFLIVIFHVFVVYDRLRRSKNQTSRIMIP
jgi:hypothetical protein